FGETYTADNCGNCDNCLNPKKQVEAKDELCAVLETVLSTKERFKADYLINVLIGRRTDEVKSYGHDELDEFGSLPDIDEKFLGAVIRQAVIAGYLTRDIENYGILKITPMGKKFLKKPVSFKVVEDTDYSDVDADVQMKSGASCAADQELYSILKDLRNKLARQLELPPYVIFQEPSLEAMATTYPITLEELQNISGVGTGKATRYGKEFVRVIKRYVEENEIERPEDIRVRQVPNRSKLKISIIQAIDRKIDLEELAESKGLEFNELLDELEAIIDAGTKINIDYFLNEIISEDQQEEVIEYFRDCQEDDLEAAIQDLGDEYSEEEIRLLRIKFLSEMGN
ncbi:MAG: HRDC domain-containing protein, partial [Muribaculaceae bacterium]|nr:HRDC domain-containing protein [Muribaculaceae bacterium]